jgi:hypothetical protein
MQNRFVLLALLIPLLVACGGSPALGSAALSGLVYEVDGQTVDRSGVEVRVAETGQTAVTGADGSFMIDGLPAGIVTLQFSSTGAAQAQTAAADPQVTLSDGTDTEVRCAMRDGSVAEFELVGHDRVRAEARLTTTDAATGQEGKVRVEQHDGGDELLIEVEEATEGDAFDVYLIDPDTGDRTFIEQIVAGSNGEAELQRHTNDGDQLPLDAASVDDLAGYGIEIEFGGEVILTGAVPELPEWVPGSGDDPTPTGHAHGKALLTAVEDGLEGYVEVGRNPRHDEEEFEIEAQHLDAGRVVRFEIRDPDTGEFVTLDTLAADEHGKAEAKFETDDGPLPLDAASVDDLAGLDVQVVDDDTGDVLLTGTVPDLVAD